MGESNNDWKDFRIEFMECVDETLKTFGGMKVKANADTAKQVMRGTPLALRTPGLYEMQTKAIFEAAKATNYVGQIEIMVPLVRSALEVSAIKDVVSAIGLEYGMQGKYSFRSMLETLTAIEEARTIATLVDGVSFGTNDLTSESMGNIKRTDVAAIQSWMSRTDHKGKSPFSTISEPVLRLLQAATNDIRSVNPSVDISICGNQVAGDPSSISACNNLGLDSISVPASPFYFYPSKIMTAQAALQGKLLAGGIGNRHSGAGVIIQKLG